MHFSAFGAHTTVGLIPEQDEPTREADMRRMVITIAAAALVMAASVAAAQTATGRGMKWQGSGGWGAGAPYARTYDDKTVEALSGTVVKIEHVTPMRGMSAGVHLILKTNAGEISVHLGPAWYIERQDVKLEPGDAVQVKGSRVTFQGTPAIIAAEVKKGDEVLPLRNDSGVPVWSGWRRG
jgi:hypothetical protein